MIPVTQTSLHLDGEPPGNCFAACLASLLHVDLATVPQPTDADRDTWVDYWPRIARWLNDEHRMALVEIRLPSPLPTTADDAGWFHSTIGADDMLYMVYGPGPRGHNHSVVFRGGEMVHDPHPSRAGLVGFEMVGILVPLDPAMAKALPLESALTDCRDRLWPNRLSP